MMVITHLYVVQFFILCRKYRLQNVNFLNRKDKRIKHSQSNFVTPHDDTVILPYPVPPTTLHPFPEGNGPDAVIWGHMITVNVTALMSSEKVCPKRYANTVNALRCIEQ